MSMQQESETGLIKESVYIDTAKKESGAWLALTDDHEKRLTENRNVVARRLDNTMKKYCNDSKTRSLL